MITDNLYQEVLLNPIKNGADELYIISGYSSATFLRKHIYEASIVEPNIIINLIIGMSQRQRDHSAYLNLLKIYPNNFKGYYYKGRPEVHSKVYAWRKKGIPLLGFSGSANYSQFGFNKEKQGNQLTEDKAEEILEYYNYLIKNSILIQEYIPTHNDINTPPIVKGSLPSGEIEWISPNKSVRISFLDKKGKLPEKSGLNWGQREGREPNQAYLSIKKDARNEGFLPEKGFTFTLLTDDKQTLDCTVQQQGRKAITTTYNNSEIGLYFRNRMSVKQGDPIEPKDLIKYGRTDFTLEKLDDETFMLDFSSIK